MNAYPELPGTYEYLSKHLELNSLWLVVGLLAQAVDLLLFFGLLALVADVLGHVLGGRLRDADAAAVEPVAAHVASDVEPSYDDKAL